MSINWGFVLLVVHADHDKGDDLTGFGDKIGKSSEDDVNSKRSNRSTKTEQTSNKRSDSKTKATSNLKRVDESAISESTSSATSVAKEAMGTTTSAIESMWVKAASRCRESIKMNLKCGFTALARLVNLCGECNPFISRCSTRRHRSLCWIY